MKKYLFICFPALLLLNSAYGQTDAMIKRKRMVDSITMAMRTAMSINYPGLRQGFVSTEFTGKSDVDAKLEGSDFFKAKARSVRIRSNFNIPISQWGKNTLTAGINYLHQRTELDQISNFIPEIPVNAVSNTSTIGFVANFTRVDSLFRTPVIYSASIAGFTNELTSVKRINYTGLVTFPLKRTATTSYSLGLVFLADPTIETHFIPIFSYWHKFKTLNMELYIDLPSRLLMKTQVLKNGWLGLGTELNGNLAFYSSNNHILPDNFTNSTTVLKSGPSFEYRIAKKIILGTNAGLFSTVSSKSFKQKGGYKDSFMKINNGAASYLNFTISVLPFLK